jgi:hypothetical protein
MRNCRESVSDANLDNMNNHLLTRALLGSGRRGDLATPNALGVANFFWLGKPVDVAASNAFRRGRQNVHARARALPG